MNTEVRAIIFDFDNTIVNMPTKILLFHQGNKSYLELTTDAFAKYKSFVGKEGIFKHCSFDHNSFKEFRTHDDSSFFIDDIVELIRSGNPSKWQAFYYEKFLEMLSTEEDAQNVYILSARGHKVEEFLDGLRILQSFLEKKHSLKIHLPRKEHIFFVGDNPNIADAKADVIKEIIKKESLENTTHIEFADDDHDNIKKAQEMLQGFIKPFAKMSFFVSHVMEKAVNTIKINHK